MVKLRLMLYLIKKEQTLTQSQEQNENSEAVSKGLMLDKRERSLLNYASTRFQFSILERLTCGCERSGKRENQSLPQPPDLSLFSFEIPQPEQNVNERYNIINLLPPLAVDSV